MISCCATPIVTMRRSILTILSTRGMRKMTPGPFASRSFPSRKITPRWYSRRIRTDSGNTKTANTTRITAAGPRLETALASSLMIAPSLGCGFDVLGQPADAGHFHRLPGFDGCLTHGIPALTFEQYLAASRIGRRERDHPLADHRFRSRANRLELCANPAADHKDEERRGDNCCRDDPGQRQREARRGVVEQHQCSEEKRRDAPHAQYPVRRRAHINDETRDRQADKRQPGHIHRE